MHCFYYNYSELIQSCPRAIIIYVPISSVRLPIRPVRFWPYAISAIITVNFEKLQLTARIQNLIELIHYIYIKINMAIFIATLKLHRGELLVAV